MRHALYLPPFGELADARALADIAVAAEEAGWDGMFFWDHVLRPADEPAEVADVWVVLAAAAVVTRSLRLGPMVTPLGRRRPHKVAREIATLDRLSGGRLTVGFGLGVDEGGELSRFGEVVDPRVRGDRLDEAADLVAALLAGEVVEHRGEHFTADGVRFLPRPAQERVPFWFAARGMARRALRRAARFDGLFPIEVDVAGLAQVVDVVRQERGTLEGFDIAVIAIPGVDLAPFEDRGATWAMWSFLPGHTRADVERFVAGGPAAHM